MTLEHVSKYRLVLVVVFGVLIVFGLGFLASQKADHQGPATSGPASVKGEYVCLPHRDTSGPQTMECAYGLKADGGGNYAMDTSALMVGGQDIQFVTGAKILVQGTLVTDQSISPEVWQEYDIKGILKVSKLTVY